MNYSKGGFRITGKIGNMSISTLTNTMSMEAALASFLDRGTENNPVVFVTINPKMDTGSNKNG